MLSLMALEVGKIHPHWHPLIGDEVVKFDFDNSGVNYVKLNFE